MIPYETYSICGCFEYPVFCADTIKSFVDRVTSGDSNDLMISCFSVEAKKFAYADWSNGRYNSEKIRLGNAVKNNYIPVDFDFKIEGVINASFYLRFLDDKYYEISINLKNEDLDKHGSSVHIVDYVKRIFFSTFLPVYGCAGIEMFIEPPEKINDDILKMLFYECGFVNEKYYSAFKQRVSESFLNQYNISLADNMYVFNPKSV